MKIQYSPGEVPKRGEHQGFTFQNGRIGATAMSSQKNDRCRNVRQTNKKLNLMTANGHWRNLSPAEKANWTTFAATYPQPSHRNPAIPLTGYQLFIKRQQYLFLNEGITDEFMSAPFSEVLNLDEYTFTVDQTENCIDVTENYIRNFGLIPSPGQFVQIKVLPYAIKSGQFFPIVTQTIEILESYIDGLFVSLHLPANCRDTVFSVYLSKPFNRSVIYPGTKSRYMGCFTTKTFLGLTDTPDSYENQAGKKVVVKADESGLEFVPDSGGGLTCETLPACSKIISIDDSIAAIVDIIVGAGSSSFPPIRYGALYNGKAVKNADPIAPAGWHIATEADWDNLIAYAGGLSVASNKLRELGFSYWSSPNTGATNEYKFNARGGGFRSGSDPFSQLNSRGYYMSGTIADPPPQGYNTRHVAYQINNSSGAVTKFFGTYGGLNDFNGCSLRMVKDSTSLQNGQSSTMTGNDGKVYRTICINGKEWTADNCAETKYRSGAYIYGHDQLFDNATWYSFFTTQAAMCPYGNDFNNILL